MHLSHVSRVRIALWLPTRYRCQASLADKRSRDRLRRARTLPEASVGALLRADMEGAERARLLALIQMAADEAIVA